MVYVFLLIGTNLPKISLASFQPNGIPYSGKHSEGVNFRIIQISLHLPKN